MAKESKPEPGSVARAKRIHEEIEALKRKGSAPDRDTGAPDGSAPRSLRDIIHDRMNRPDEDDDDKKGG